MTVFVIIRINPRATRMIVKDQNGCDLITIIDIFDRHQPIVIDQLVPFSVIYNVDEIMVRMGNNTTQVAAIADRPPAVRVAFYHSNISLHCFASRH
jgi:hypothetical protein